MALTIRPKVIGDQVIATSDNSAKICIYIQRGSYFQKTVGKVFKCFSEDQPKCSHGDDTHILKLAFQEFVFYPLYMYFRLRG